MALRLETLGGLRVLQNGAELTQLPRQKLRCALLLYLAVEREGPRERLLHLFWPEREPEKGRRTLSQMLYELKQTLGDDWAELRSERVVVGPDVSIDALDFVQAMERGDSDEATRLYRGPFLSAHHLANTPEFERWLDQQRSRFDGMYREAQARRVETLTQAGDLGGAIAAARRWVLAEPLEDEAQHRLIELLAQSGLRNEAIRQYDDYCDRLAEIDAVPIEAVTDLVERLKSGALEIAVQSSTATRSAPQLQARTGVVVFRIADHSPGEANEYFCDGLSEEIMHVLGRVSGIRVVPRTSAFAFDKTGIGVRAAARELGVTHAVEGSANFTGDRYRVRIALIEAEHETELWNDRFEGVLATDDVFELQDRIAAAVLDALGPRLEAPAARPEVAPSAPAHPQVGRRNDTSSPDAHALYLRGRHAWFSRTPRGLERALAYFEEAVEEDPTYARAHAGIADVFNVLGAVDYSTRPPVELYPRARAAAERALELDPELSEAHAALGNYLMSHAWDWAGAEEAFTRSIRLNPGYSNGRQWYSNYLMAMGQEDDAITEAALALELDPRSAFLSSSLARHFQLMRQPQRAVEQYHRAIELDPGFTSAHAGLALAELQCGRPEIAVEIVLGLSEAAESPIPLLQALHAYAVGLMGDEKQATKLVQQLKATSAPYLPPEYVSLAYLGIGDNDRALDWLEKAVEARSQMLTLLNVEPAFDPLRGHERFRAMLAEVGF